MLLMAVKPLIRRVTPKHHDELKYRSSILAQEKSRYLRKSKVAACHFVLAIQRR